jgi:uncharacterized SAM-binding protein YcdF (DUF218 family)
MWFHCKEECAFIPLSPGVHLKSFMSLFLSKLLPLFVYPLGISCLLLIAAIAIFWKRPRRAAVCLGISLAVILLFSNNLMAQSLLQSLESRYSPLMNPPQVGAIVVLGGCTRPPSRLHAWPEVSESGDRIIYGARLYRDGVAPKVILSGGSIPWSGRMQPEALDMATLIQLMGVPPQALLLETGSLNTYENAVNTKALLKAQQILEPIVLVTTASHMPRAMGIFRKLGIQAIAAPTDFLAPAAGQPKTFLGGLLGLLPDATSLDQSTLALKEYVGTVIYWARGWL